MKTSKLFMLLIVMVAFLFGGSIYAQNVGIAADKQKQENLEKNKKRQAELKKKYNSMTPEQKAEAKKKADAYKTGGKTNSNTSGKPATLPAASNPNQRAVQVHQSKPRSNKPVWMDPNGHAKTTPAPSKPAEKDVKPAVESKTKPSTTPAKPAVKPTIPPTKTKSEIKVK
jgi:hypothetical protein